MKRVFKGKRVLSMALSMLTAFSVLGGAEASMPLEVKVAGIRIGKCVI